MACCGVAGLQPDLHAGVGRSKAVQEVDQDAVAGGDRAVEADSPRGVGRPGR